MLNADDLICLCREAKKFPPIKLSGKSDYCIMVLELMDSEHFPGDYCGALQCVLKAFPDIDAYALEAELDLYI